jgi:hypothetical protein
MTRKEIADVELDGLLDGTLRAAPKPRLSAGFTARALGRIEHEERRRDVFKRTSVLQAAFGISALIGTGFILAEIRWPGWLSPALLVSTPIVFLGLAFSRRFMPGISALIERRERA